MDVEGLVAALPHAAAPETRAGSLNSSAVTIATVSSGFEKGDFLVREEKGMRVYFDFFEEAFNYIANKGYKRMPKEEDRRAPEIGVRIRVRAADWPLRSYQPTRVPSWSNR